MPSREGGVEVVVEELSTRMAALGHEVSVYSRKGHNVVGSEFDGPLFEQDEYEWRGVHVRQVPTIDIKGLAAVTSSYSSMRAAVASKPDVIHVHAEGPSAAIGMARRAGIRAVATIHGLDWQRAKWGKLASRYIKHGEAVAAKKADEIIVLSEGVRAYFLSEYGRETRFVPNGITPVPPVKPHVIRQKYGLEEDGYVLFLGCIVPEKGLHYLVEAWRQVNTGMCLVIAGGPSDSQKYYEQILQRAKGDARVLLVGFVQGQELRELYSNAAVFVLPSDFEGMPMGLLEAMSYGRCCLTSDISECVDVLAETGVTFAKGNVASLAHELTRLLKDKELRVGLGLRALERVSAKYDWDSVVERTLELYQHKTANEGAGRWPGKESSTVR